VVRLPSEAGSEVCARRSPYPRCQHRMVIADLKFLGDESDFLRRQIMNVKVTLMLMLALGSTAAAAETAAEKTGVNSALGIAPKTQDFVTEAAVSDMT
jgi:hypothetical protein